MISKQKLYSIALLSTALVLMLVNIAGAAPFAYITNSVSNTVSVIDTSTNTVVGNPIPVGNYPYGVAISPDGTKVYVANSDNPGTVSVIDTVATSPTYNTVIKTVTVGQYPYGVAVSPDGKKVYVTEGYDPGQVSVIDTVTNQVAATINVGKLPTGIAATPDGTKIYVANGGSGTVFVIDTVATSPTYNTVIKTVTVGSAPQGVAVSPDGKKVYVTTGSSPGNVYVIDTATNQVTATVPVGNYPNGVTVTPDGTKVYAANSNYGHSGTVSVIDTTSTPNTVTYTITVGSLPYGVAVTPDGTKIYVANVVSNSVSVIDVASNTVKTSVNVGTHPYVIGQFIGKANPTITWNQNPTTITYGTALVAGQLNAVATDLTSGTPGTPVPGTFVYTDEAGNVVTTTTILSAGTHTLTATFTSTDPNYASGGMVTATITVNKATPTITWTPNPLSCIVYGTALDADLDATATYNGQTVPGNFVYTDEAGNVVTATTVLSVGTHTLTATFTPTDTADYISGGTVQNSITVIAPIKKEEHNEEENICDRDNYCGPGCLPIPGLMPGPMMYGSPMINGPMYGSPMSMYGNEQPYGYGSEPYGPTESPNSGSNVHKAKAHLSKNKHKNHSKHHTTKQHKTEKKNT